jgi:hypothetical protein
MKIENAQGSTHCTISVCLQVSGWEPTFEYSEGWEYITEPDGSRKQVQKKSKRKLQVQRIDASVYAGQYKEGELPEMHITLRGHWAKKDGRGWFVDTAWINRKSIDDLPPVFAREIVECVRAAAIETNAATKLVEEVCSNTLGEESAA